MKELSFERMEEVNGRGDKGAGCMVVGAVIAAASFFIWTGIGAGIVAGGIYTAASYGCFENE